MTFFQIPVIHVDWWKKYGRQGFGIYKGIRPFSKDICRNVIWRTFFQIPSNHVTGLKHSCKRAGCLLNLKSSHPKESSRFPHNSGSNDIYLSFTYSLNSKMHTSTFPHFCQILRYVLTHFVIWILQMSIVLL